MGNTVVGIKTAQGEFFPILDPAAGKKRRVVLVPSREGQENVKIQLYEQHQNDPAELLYLSSIFLENIGHAENGDSEIELVLSADPERNVYATAKDLVTGEQKSISVAPREDDVGDFSIPSAEFDNLSGVMPRSDSPGEPEPGSRPVSEVFTAGKEFGVGAEGKPVQPGVRPLYLVLFVLAGLVLILVVAYLILRGTQGEAPSSSGAALAGGVIRTAVSGVPVSAAVPRRLKRPFRATRTD